jgi:hypothetical protein
VTSVDAEVGTLPLTPGWAIWPEVVVRSTGLPIELVGAFAVPDLDTGAEIPDETVREVTTGAVRSALLDDRFLAAICWQNPAVVTTWAARMAAAARSGEPILTSRRNERERVISRYVQRYCTKNESIGFFGPVAWAHATGDAEDLSYTGGLGIRRQSVSLETWAVAALAAAWRDDPAVLPLLPVRLDPAATVTDGWLFRPRHRPVRLASPDTELLAALPGGERCGPLARQVAAATGADEEKILARLVELGQEGIVQVGFMVPFDEFPERHLARQLSELPPGETRTALTNRLDRLTGARDQVEAVAVRPRDLQPALDTLAREFEAAGGIAGRTLERGQRGRTVAYLDCRRDLDVRLGPRLVDALRAPLGLLLNSARWLAAVVGAAVEAYLRAQYHDLRAQGPVNLADLQLAGAPALVPGGPVVQEVFEDFQLRWSELLLEPDPAGMEPARLSSQDLAPMVDVLFPPRVAPWAAARRHSPDLLLARQPDGRLQWVLGELHVAMNTLESRVFRTQADDPGTLISATAADFPGGRLVPMYPHDARPSNTRTYPPPALDPPGQFLYWSFGADQGHESGARSLPATAISVHERDRQLVGTADGLQAPVLEFFGEFLTAVTVNLFQLRQARARLPRLLIDDVVVARQSWCSPPAAIPLPASRTKDYSYGGIRSWAAGQGIPRHAFVTVPGEPKPVYVDFCAPALLDNLARLIRRAVADQTAEITVTEMLPEPGQLWLADSAGGHYAAELRFVAVDQQTQDAVVGPAAAGV